MRELAAHVLESTHMGTSQGPSGRRLGNLSTLRRRVFDAQGINLDPSIGHHGTSHPNG
jgi:hypothetical protein